jgi:hypothetical protein
VSKDKKIIHYWTVPPAEVGKRALIRTTDHPNSRNDPESFVITSPVVAIRNDGFEIETHNTIYVPAEPL